MTIAPIIQEGSMRGIVRLAAIGAALFGATRWLNRARQALAQRPAAEIRRTVEGKLPAGLDDDTKHRISKAAVQAIKGTEPVVVEATDPPARSVGSPPSPELPSTREEQ
jgi:hypothetical protein